MTIRVAIAGDHRAVRDAAAGTALALTASGRGNRQIARDLGIGEQAVTRQPNDPG